MSLGVNLAGVTPMNSVSFKSKAEGSKGGVKNQNTHASTLNNTAMIGLAALGMVGVALVALKRGKALGAIEGELNKLKELKFLDINDFKKVGKFEKGSATIDGKGFTGKLFHPKKDVVLTYKDGKLLKSEMRGGTITKYYGGKNDFWESAIVCISEPDKKIDVIKKADGTIIRTMVPKRQDYSVFGMGSKMKGKYRYFKTIVTPDGKVQRIRVRRGTISNPNFRNGEKLSLIVEKDIDTGKIVSSNYVVKPDVKLPRDKYHVYPKLFGDDPKVVSHRVKTVIDGEKVTEIYRTKGDGKLVRDVAYSGSYNPKTGVLTKTEYNCDFSTGEYSGSKWVTMTDKNNLNNKLKYHVNKDGKISDVNILVDDTRRILGGSLRTRDMTLSQAQKKIKELNLPFTIG